jgi:hypothetical protein
VAADSATIYENQSPIKGSYAGVPVREDTAYVDDRGEPKDRVRKQTQKAIDGLQDALRKVLEPGEVVFALAAAYLPSSAVDRFFLGAVGSFTDRGFLVLTDRRLLFFLANRRGGWKRSVRSVRWGDVESARVKGPLNPTLEVRYHNGKQEEYWRLGRPDGKKIRSLLAPLLAAGRGEQSAAQGMVHLCPECLEPLQPGNYQCLKCHLEFKNEKAMAARAWLFPGAAYAYTSHRGLAAWQVIIEAVLLLEIAFWAATATGVLPADRADQTSGDAWIVAGFFAAALLIERLFTSRHCRRFVREYIPAK